MLSNIGTIYRDSVRFAVAMPLIFLVPALPELIQHVVEFRLGMYDSIVAFRASAASNERMTIGFVKVLALLLPGYWLVRYMAWGDAGRAVQPEGRALTLWLPVFAFSAASGAVELFAPPLHQLAGVAGRGGMLLDGSARLLLSVLSIYLTAWSVAAPLGNAAVGPLRSLQVMGGFFWQTVLYLVAGALPLMAVHYGLGLGGIGRSAAVTAVMLAIDGLVVALLAHCMTAATFVAAHAAFAHRGIGAAGTPLGRSATT
jgi:hypothetical protein